MSLTLEEFKKIYKPIKQREGIYGLEKYILDSKDRVQHDIVKLVYSMHTWTLTDDNKIINGKRPALGNKYIITQTIHNVDEDIIVNLPNKE